MSYPASGNYLTTTTSLEYVKGIGPKIAELLFKELALKTVGDLLLHFPFRHVDRSRFYSFSQLHDITAEVQVKGKIIDLKTEGRRPKERLVATFTDGEQTAALVWFKGIKWVKESLRIQEDYVLYGKPSVFQHQLSFVHPELSSLSSYKSEPHIPLAPVYSTTERLKKQRISNAFFQKRMVFILKQVQWQQPEFFPPWMLEEYALIPKPKAIFSMHFPQSLDDLKKAQHRLKFEELFFTQMQLLLKQQFRKTSITGQVFEQVGDYFNRFYNELLTFELTHAQKRVLKEIRADLKKGSQMNRLLQGDVGSGKTIVALMTCLLAIDNGFQACIMAPTEILAQQHFEGMKEDLQRLGIEVALLTGSTKAADRKPILTKVADGSLKLLIGTHALLEDKVQFKELGLAVIDEQHRFGVAQRAKLWKKNNIPPHILVMTATPIPRTLAMSLYGDLDISVIDELPPGRKPIQTLHMFDNNRLKINHFLKKQIKSGRQVYVVYPLIEESEKLDYKNLEDGYRAMQRDFPEPEYQISIVHGKLSNADKEWEMQRFIKGQTQILVATTVIEVGVNVPNASVMLIENAERFGLSQLHQLRGRVGRGAEQSYCLLISSFKLTEEAKTRLST
ncbi:MAG: ATP-dependent DNA helicase RecG, partial [Flavobacteriaceae bacterium]|nr:ATP-dependent DNA helicase RecG [Flavobacteriaceae bacterium]